MTAADPAPVLPGRNEGGGRLQAILAIASMAAAVAITVVLVATPASSAGSDAPAIPSAPSAGLSTGLRMEVQGGEALDAFALADRLAAAGASVRGVEPLASGEDLAARTAIVYYDLRSRPAAEQVRSMLGSGTLQRRQVFQPEVDVTIVLGKDLPRL